MTTAITHLDSGEPMLKTADAILAAYEERRRLQMPLQSLRAEIRDIYTNNVKLDLPGVPKEQIASVPNLLRQGLDQTAGRVASVVPMVSFSPDSDGRTAERRAATASRVVNGWWKADNLPLKMHRRARHLVGYGASPVKITWNPRTHRPEWRVRSTLETYPNPDQTLDNGQPADIMFAYQRSVGWLKANGYGEAFMYVTTRDGRPRNDDLMVLIEYVSPEQCTLVLTGYKNTELGNVWLQGYAFGTDTKAAMILNHYETGGIMVASNPERITLDMADGQFDGMVGMYKMQAEMMALDVVAVQRAIFPDTYLVSRPNETAKFVEGPFDGRSGLVNVVQGGDIKTVSEAPGYQTTPTIDRLERNQRVTAGIPAEFGGESGTNIRTGRRGDAVLSSTIDFPIAEAQEVLAKALQDENRAAIALAKKYDGRATRTIYVGTGNTTRAVKYDAETVFKQEEHVVSYPVAGTDLNSLLIGLGQRVGLGTLSKRSAAEFDPYISSPEQEHDRIIAEGLEQALVGSFQQQAAAGAIPPMVVARVMQLVQSDRKELAEAITYATEEAARKAQEQAAAQQAGQPQAPDALAMAAPATAQSMTGSPIPGPTQGQGDLASLLSTLRKPAMTIQPMRGVSRGAM